MNLNTLNYCSTIVFVFIADSMEKSSDQDLFLSFDAYMHFEFIVNWSIHFLAVTITPFILVFSPVNSKHYNAKARQQYMAVKFTCRTSVAFLYIFFME